LAKVLGYYYLGAYKKSLKLLYILYNESKHNKFLAMVPWHHGKAKKTKVQILWLEE
jgi:hypothetical protein